MRVVLMSDIHGNKVALEAVVGALPLCDRVIVAGDLCLEGADPAGVVDWLIELGWDLVMGNTDQEIVSPPVDAKQKKREIIGWTRGRLGDERISRLAKLPFSRTIRDGSRELALVVHANPRTNDEHLYPTLTEKELEPYLAGVTAELIAFGHLHIPYVRPVLGKLLVDVSSVGHPKDRDPRSAFTIVEWTGDVRSVTQVRVPYDVDRAVHELRTCSMPHAEEQIDDLLKASY